MTPEQRDTAEEWITLFEQASQDMDHYIVEHAEGLDDQAKRRLWQAQRDGAGSLAEDLRNQLKEGQGMFLVWAVWVDVEDEEPIAYCLSRASAAIVYDSFGTTHGVIIPYHITRTAWMSLHSKTFSTDVVE